MSTPSTITIVEGDTLLRLLTVLDENEDPVDLTGYEARCEVRASADSVSAIASLTVTIDPDQVTNKGQLSILYDDTSGWPIAQLVGDLRLKTPASRFDTSELFTIRVLKGSTRRWA